MSPETRDLCKNQRKAQQERLNKKEMEKLKNFFWKRYKYDASISKDASASKASSQPQSSTSPPKENITLATMLDLGGFVTSSSFQSAFCQQL
jgi:hypothetical protein